MESPAEVTKAYSRDLDAIVESFDKWQCMISSLMKERNQLQTNLNNLENIRDKLLTKNAELEATINMLNGTMDGLHKHLNLDCDSDEQLRALQSLVEEKDQEIDNMKLLLESQTKDRNEQLKELEHCHRAGTEELRAELMGIAKAREDELQAQMEAGKLEIADLENRMEQFQKDKEKEIVMLTVDFENKLTKLKQKSATAPQSGGNNNQEIFRKKLQHMKSEHDQEVERLRQTITELQDKVNSQQDQRSEGSGNKRQKQMAM